MTRGALLLIQTKSGARAVNDASIPVVKQLDHVIARVDGAQGLFSTLTETLGLERVKEVVAGVRDFRRAREMWARLYAPATEVSKGVLEVDGGPALRLVESGENSIQSLALQVSSLERAETHLRERGMIGAVTDDEITVAPEKIEGLKLRLVQ